MSTQKNEHNPDNLTPEQYGAPEWRLLTKEEYGRGFEHEIHGTIERWTGSSWQPFGSGWFPFVTYRRRITPPPDTTGSGREGETPETDALWVKLMAALGKAGIHPKEANDAFGILEPIRQLERQRDAALAQVEALRRDGERMVKSMDESLTDLAKWMAARNPHPSDIESAMVRLRAAIDSAQRQEGR